VKHACVVLLAVWAGTATAQDTRRPMTPADAFALQEVGEIRISPDASTVVFSVTATDLQANQSRTRLMRVPAKGGAPTELENIPDEVTTIRWSPDGRRLAFFATRDGRRALWTYELASSELRRLCDYDRSDAFVSTGNWLSWSPDGSRLAFAGTLDSRRTPDTRRTHIYVVSAARRGVTAVTSGESDDHSLDWGGDGSEIVFLSNRRRDGGGPARDDVFAVGVSSGRVRPLTATPGAEREPRVSPDGQWVAYVGEDTHIFAMPIGGASAKVDSGGARELTHALDRRSSAPEWTPDGRAILYTAFDRGKTVLYRVSLHGSASVALIDRKARVGPFSMARDGLIAVGVSDPQTPREVYRFRPDAYLQPLTSLNGATVGHWQLVAPEAVPFGADTDAWYYPAAGRTRPAAGSIPLIVSIHRGTPGANGYAFNAGVQVQSARGYATLVVQQRNGPGDDSATLMASIEHLLTIKPEIDGGRLGVTAREDGIVQKVVAGTTRFKAAVSMSSTPARAHASDGPTPMLIVHEFQDPAHDLDRMERTLAWYDCHLRPQASGIRGQGCHRDQAR
jgi:Tol biopolymer transport system component